MNRTGVLLVVIILAALVQPALAQDEEPPVVLRLDGTEGPDCPVTDGHLICYLPTEGDPDTAFEAGRTVRVELTAAGDAPHAIAVIDAAEQAPGHLLTGVLATPIAESDTVDAGGVAVLEFTVPESGTLYFFCTVPDHEPVGMWFESDVQPRVDVLDGDNNTTADQNETDGEDGNITVDVEAGTGADDPNNTTGGDDVPDTEDSPALAPAAAIAALVAVAAATRRRRSV